MFQIAGARTEFPAAKSIHRGTLWFWRSLEKKSREEAVFSGSHLAAVRDGFGLSNR
jgi:hypothetical protein